MALIYFPEYIFTNGGNMILESKKVYPEEPDTWKETKEYVVLTKASTVKIPPNFRRELEPGQEVIIYLKSKAIVIKKKEYESIENQAIVGRYGSLYVPKEIRTVGNIKSGTKFAIVGEQDGKSIKLIPYR